MGCDIHSNAERRNEAGLWEKIDGLEPFEWRSYSIFAFLAGVRNYSNVIPIAEMRGMPDDASPEVAADYEEWNGDAHSASWLTMEELLAFDYDAPTEDCRVTRQIGPNLWSGGCTCAPGEGLQTSYREFLGDYFFDELQQLKESGAERIVFWFDN